MTSFGITNGQRRRPLMLSRSPEVALLEIIQVISRMDSEGNYGPSIDTHNI